MKLGESAPSFQNIIIRIDAFIRKYYLNQIIRGSIFSIAFLVFAFLLFVLSEYFLFLPGFIRSLLFYGFIISGIISIGYWVIIPTVRYFKLGSIISTKDAAIIIGKHFSEIDDRLLNILELKELVTPQNASLIEAGIQQKTDQIKPIAFTNAINLKFNNKYLIKFLTPAILSFFIIYITNSRIIKEGSSRIIQYQKDFEKDFPFVLEFTSGKLEVVQNNNYVLTIKVGGQQIPDELNIQTGQSLIKMTKKGKNLFEYTFNNVQQNIAFRFSTSRFSSGTYNLIVLKKPFIASFNVTLNYPSYTQIPNESFNNLGDISVPAGTEIFWTINTNNTDDVRFKVESGYIETIRVSSSSFKTKHRAIVESPYSIYLKNTQGNIADSANYLISVIPDLFPTLFVDEIIDSANSMIRYFSGSAGDDYGLRLIQFKYSLKNSKNNDRTIDKSIIISNATGKNDAFSHYFNVSDLNLEPGDQVQYYFEAWDNDAINGSKSTRSRMYSIEIPDESEINKMVDKNNQDLKKDLEKSIQDLNNLNNDLKESQKDLIQKKNLDWEDKKKINELLNNQKDLLKKLEQIQKDYDKNNNLINDLKTTSPELKEKQEKLKELANEVLSPEMQDLMKKIQDLMEKMNKENTLEQLKSNEKQNEKLEKDLDRMLSLFKQLEFEQKFNEIKDGLKELANEQDKLTQELQSNKTKEELEKKQDEINKKFDDLKNELKELNDLNNELDNPMSLPDMNEKSKKTESELDKSLDDIKKGNNSKASESQRNASKNMKEMANSMESFMDGAQMEQMEEDLRAIRQILENIIKVSFKQEELVNKMKKVNTTAPIYVQLIKDQNRIKEDIKLIEDSIQSLAKRQVDIQSYVDEQLTIIKDNNELAIDNMVERFTSQSVSNQQFIITSLNNLALMFDESLKQMQQQMSSKMPGNQSCSKPGGKGKPSLGNMSQIQKQLNDKLSEMQGQMKPGQKPGQQNGTGMSEQLAKIAAQQATIREALRQLNDQYNKDGKGSLGNLNQIQDLMDKTERDLANKMITNETLKRQQDILTKLLEAEKAERERDTDNKRKSESATEVKPVIPPSLQEYIKKKQQESELIRTLPPDLKPYFKNITEDYFNQIPK
jgi:hypothetical protein